MEQAEFHTFYEQMPESFRAELIDGTVFVSMPLGKLHAKGHVLMSAIMAAYAGYTPGVEALSDATLILGKDDEVQPDLLLRVLPTLGGKSADAYDQFIQGSPELVCEVAYSSRAIDLHLKRRRYAQAGVLEYIVLCLEPREIRWFDFATGSMITPNDSGVLRSKAFPGLWMANQSVLQLDYLAVMDKLTEGLASAEHAAFATELKRSAANQG
jgi:Uma2 family endonuclease